MAQCRRTHPIACLDREAAVLGTQQLERDAGRVAEPRGALGDGIQHMLEIGGRGRDHPQNVSRRGVLLQRFADSAVTIVKLCAEGVILLAGAPKLGL